MIKQMTVMASKKSAFRSAVEFLKANALLSGAAAGVVLIAVAFVSIRVASHHEMEVNASFAFSQARKLDDLVTIAGRYPASRVYVPTLMSIANILQREGRTDEAIKYYVDIALRYKDHYLAPRALCNLGYAYQDKGDNEMAFQCYSKVLKEYPQSGWENEASYNLARCYELLGKPDKALELYTAILLRNPTTEWHNDIKYRLTKLKETK